MCCVMHGSFSLPISRKSWPRVKSFVTTKRYFCSTLAEIYTTDAERKQTLDEAVETYQAMYRAYQDCGYEIVELPRDTVEARARFHREKLSMTCPGQNSTLDHKGHEVTRRTFPRAPAWRPYLHSAALPVHNTRRLLSHLRFADRAKRRLFPHFLSILTIVKSYCGFNIPAGWARRSFKRRAVNRLEPLRSFQHPRSGTSVRRSRNSRKCIRVRS